MIRTLSVRVVKFRLRGEHNVYNVLAACAIAGFGRAFLMIVMRETILNFKAVPHRLETMRELDGVTYVNDSIATAPERTSGCVAEL